MTARFFCLLTLVSALTLPGVRAADSASNWGTDYAAALKEAAATNRPILADFTGSDWCPWCIRLVKDTFSKPKFQAFAKDNVVLLEVDFPQGKEQSAELKKQNEGLKEKFGVEGFPTVVLIDKEGNEIARNVGYLQGGPEAMIDWVNKSKAKP
jgi:thioredoxin-related protein